MGDGGWGTALALVLHRNGHAVRVWGAFPDYTAETRHRGENFKFLPGVPLPPELGWTAAAGEALDQADAVVLAVPSRFFRASLERFAALLPASAMVLSVTKGLDPAERRRMTEVAESVLSRRPVAALSGPSLAAEVARGVPTAVTVACTEHRQAAAWQRLFSNAAFRVYTSDDVIGVELGGALKNIVAIAAGISDGIGFGDNSKAALVTRGLAEMTRLGRALGAHPATFAGLSGLGDLFVTCASRQSRNRGVGERLGRGESIAHILEGMEQVAEGVWTCEVARQLAEQHRVSVPIIEEVCAVIHRGRDPRAAVQALMTRELRHERD